MENVTEALKLAFSVLFFVGALTISIMIFSQARETSDILLYRQDPTNYYEYVEASNNKNRVVGVETIIPTLYRYYKENYTVVFKTGSLDEEGNLITKGPITIYETKTDVNNWNEGYDWKNCWGSSASDTYRTQITSFDLDEENKRHEPWVGKTKDIKLNMDAFIAGKEYVYQTDSQGRPIVSVHYNNFNKTGMGFYEACKKKNYKFVETLGEYALNENIVYKKDPVTGEELLDKNGNKIIDYDYTDSSTIINIDGEIVNLIKPKKKRIITYILING